MKLIKKTFNIVIFVLVILALFQYQEISNFIVNNLIYNKNAISDISKGEYSKEIDYQFVQITDDFVAKDYQHLINIIYTILDSGNESFSFYCDEQFKDCLDIMDNLMQNKNDNNVLAELNNYVHPYYTYKGLRIKTNNLGKVTISLEKQYSKEEIAYINEQLKIIDDDISKNTETNEDKIKAVHDYIINNTKYDIERAKNMNSPTFKDSKTHTAYGLLTENKSLCGGYSDFMSIYIHNLGIDNIRISGSNHVWNLVNTKDGWRHLDVTWDDPVTNTGEDILLYDYFLITTEDLRKADPIEHQFNQDIYLDA